MSIYLDVRETPFRTVPHPGWFTDDGEPVSDGWLAENGFHLVVQPDQTYDPEFQRMLDVPLEDWPIEDGVATRLVVIEDIPLVGAQRYASRQIDIEAETARGALLTTGSGQALEYDETRSEANRWAMGVDQDPGHYPMLMAEWNAMRATDPDATFEAVVADAMHQSVMWQVIGAKIKEVRRTGKVLAEVASDIDRVRNILAWARQAFTDVTTTGRFEPPPAE